MKKQVTKQINKMGYISREGLGSQSSNFVCRETVDVTKVKMGLLLSQPALSTNNLEYLRTTLRIVFQDQSFRNSYLNTIGDVLNINNSLFIKKLSNFLLRSPASTASKRLIIRTALVQGQTTLMPVTERRHRQKIRLLHTSGRQTSAGLGSFIKVNASRHFYWTVFPKFSSQ